METKKQLIISKSKDNKTYFKQKGQQYYCYLPEDRYNEYIIALSSQRESSKQSIINQNNEYSYESNKILDCYRK